jgi:hypothetical protein
MMGPIRSYLAEEDVQISRLVAEALSEPRGVRLRPFELMRERLMRHIYIEEKILFPAARRLAGSRPLPFTDRLGADHARISALLDLPPTRAVAEEILAILGPHNQLENGPDGVYDVCEELTRTEAEALLAAIRAAPVIILPAPPACVAPNDAHAA